MHPDLGLPIPAMLMKQTKENTASLLNELTVFYTYPVSNECLPSQAAEASMVVHIPDTGWGYHKASTQCFLTEGSLIS